MLLTDGASSRNHCTPFVLRGYPLCSERGLLPETEHCKNIIAKLQYLFLPAGVSDFPDLAIVDRRGDGEACVPVPTDYKRLVFSFHAVKVSMNHCLSERRGGLGGRGCHPEKSLSHSSSGNLRCVVQYFPVRMHCLLGANPPNASNEWAQFRQFRIGVFMCIPGFVFMVTLRF